MEDAGSCPWRTPETVQSFSDSKNFHSVKSFLWGWNIWWIDLGSAQATQGIAAPLGLRRKKKGWKDANGFLSLEMLIHRVLRRPVVFFTITNQSALEFDSHFIKGKDSPYQGFKNVLFTFEKEWYWLALGWRNRSSLCPYRKSLDISLCHLEMWAFSQCLLYVLGSPPCGCYSFAVCAKHIWAPHWWAASERAFQRRPCRCQQSLPASGHQRPCHSHSALR